MTPQTQGQSDDDDEVRRLEAELARIAHDPEALKRLQSRLNQEQNDEELARRLNQEELDENFARELDRSIRSSSLPGYPAWQQQQQQLQTIYIHQVPACYYYDRYPYYPYYYHGNPGYGTGLGTGLVLGGAAAGLFLFSPFLWF